ncbi:contact-dependent growth inhibition system immunity protein [Streptomyces bauhiniae]
MMRPRDITEEGERFPELHELLSSYAFAGNTFTDSTEEAGPALHAYVRQALRTPGALDRVIAEIDDLLRTGLFSDEIADDVDALPHVDPPAGRTVGQCLAVIRSHLQRIRDGGTYQHSAVPQTDWEWRRRFPELRHLLAAQFNQDFSRFYGSHGEALDDYFSANPEDAVAETAREIESLLSMAETDGELDRVTEVLGLQVYPPDGVSLRRWLTDIRDIITHR